ncbi:MAG: cyclic dehypoxanthinyl futalosine synthase [Vampirovibrionales bacterium]
MATPTLLSTDAQFIPAPPVQMPSGFRSKATPRSALALESRLNYTEALRLLNHTPLLDLGALATEAKHRHHAPSSPVTFVVDMNVNYTNICNVDCLFCAFYRKAGDADAYVLTVEQLAAKAQRLVDAEGTQFLVQGGVHPDLPFSYYTTLLKELKQAFPTLTLHAFSTSEISYMAQLTGQSLFWVLEQLIEAGLDSIPGAGAEILHDDIRHRVSPKKIGSHGWLEVMEVAHHLGLQTTATMMFGMGEQPWHRLEHLFQLRALQDRTGGFTAFIPWTFQAPNTQLAKLPIEYQATGEDFLRMVALARLVLDNIPNIQSSWLTQGEKLCQTALAFGANDIGGLVLEENVVTEAGVKHHEKNRGDALKMIHNAGFDAAQRNTRYELLHTYPRS